MKIADTSETGGGGSDSHFFFSLSQSYDFPFKISRVSSSWVVLARIRKLNFETRARLNDALFTTLLTKGSIIVQLEIDAYRNIL